MKKLKSKKRFEGYLMMDHRASPGIPEDMARLAGLPVVAAGSTLYECATLHCCHCGGCWVPNTYRIRERGYCRSCDMYLCDSCVIEAAKPLYKHRSFKQLADMVMSGRYTVSGTSSAPVLTLKGI